MEVLPLFERRAPEFEIARTSEIDWTKQADYVQRVVRDGLMDLLNDQSTAFSVGKILDICFENNEFDRITDIYSYVLSPTNRSTNSNAEVIIPRLLAFLLQKPNMAIHFARLCPWNALPPSIAQILLSKVPTILKAFIDHSHLAGDLILEPFKDVLTEASHFSLEVFRDLVQNIALTVRSPDLALELFLHCLEPMGNSVFKQSPQVTRYFIKHIFGAALDHSEEANEPSNPGQELWHLKIITFKVERPKLKCERRVDAPQLERLSTGDHVRFTMANAPLNAPLLPATSFDALVETSQPGEATFRCVQHPPAYVKKCAWKMKHCGSAVTTKAMIDATLKLVSEKQACCGIFENIVNDRLKQKGSLLHEATAEYHSDDLNERQNIAVSTSLKHPLTLLWGPPGTGKTHTIVRLLQALLERYPDERILVTAPTHNATDNILRKYVDRCERDGVSTRGPIRVSTDVGILCLSSIMINGRNSMKHGVEYKMVTR